MIDVDKFVASIMKCLCMPHREEAYLCRHWINKALDAQGLKFENGEIVKSQRTMAAEAKEAIFDSEDERMRKAIISLVKQSSEVLSKTNQNNMIAWLEKQKYTQRDVDDAYLKGVTDTKNELEKQGEQKPIWHNEDEEPKRDSLILLIMQSGTPIVAKIIEPNHTFNHGERWAYIDDLLENQGEHKPAWGEEDAKMFNFCCDYLDVQQCLWLKSLKDRLKGE